MRSPPAQYLIRFDDFCPTMLSDRRERFISLVARYGIKPILAVIPDNQDPSLKLQSPDPEFWDRMRSYQAAGFTIAMHGYRHLCTSRGKSLLGMHTETEFAGIDEGMQREWIRRGREVLREHGLTPRLFVAPRHGFDRTTIRVLKDEGLGIISDGFARRPFTHHQAIWIPQQLWEPVRKSTGLWTICIHTNTATTAIEEKLEKFLSPHAKEFTTFENVVAGETPSPPSMSERLAESIALLRVKLSAARKRAFPVS